MKKLGDQLSLEWLGWCISSVSVLLGVGRVTPPSLSPQYIHHRLIHLTPADYDDFVNIIRSARGAFCLTPVGMMQFNDVLQNLKRGKQTKELWQRITLEMATFSPWAAYLGEEGVLVSRLEESNPAPTPPPALLLPTALSQPHWHCPVLLGGTLLPAMWTQQTQHTGSTIRLPFYVFVQPELRGDARSAPCSPLFLADSSFLFYHGSCFCNCGIKVYSFLFCI